MFDLLLIFLAFFTWGAGIVALTSAIIRWVDMRVEQNLASRHPFAHGAITVIVAIAVAIAIVGGIIAIIWVAVKAFGA